MEPIFDRQKSTGEYLLEDLVLRCLIIIILRTLELRVTAEVTSS
jgi:hypothetical protein